MSPDDDLNLWLRLFKAEAKEVLKQIETLDMPIMNSLIAAYRDVTANENFKELERLRSRARHNEASALGHARRKEREKWQEVVYEKDAALADKDAVIADKDAQIAKLLAQLNET